jgi:serine/threonine-protein kinase RsbW
MTAGDAGDVRLTLAADGDSIRVALSMLAAHLAAAGLTPDDCATAELVLAEVLNNVAEHAYAGQGGQVAVALTVGRGGVRCRVTDRGHPMPGGTPPAGMLPEARADDLPEGGFGWFLIRELSCELRYARIGDKNVLSFVVPQGLAKQ